MRRIVLAVLVVGALFVGTGRAALADQRGVPNENACHGQVVAIGASQFRSPPPAGVQALGLANAGELNKGIRAGTIAGGGVFCG